MKPRKSIMAILALAGAAAAAEPKLKTHVSIGNLRVDHRVGGFYSFSLANNETVDAACTSDPATVWPANAGDVEGNKAALQLLLTAKSMNMTVTLRYVVSGTSCLYDQIVLE